MSSHLSPGLVSFIRQLRASEGDDVADQWGEALRKTDIEADGSSDALGFLMAVEWIVEQQRSLDEKFEALEKLLALKGKVTVSMKELTGWR